MRERNQILFLLLLGAEFVDVIAAQRIVGSDKKPDRAVDPGKFLDDGSVLDVTEPGTAIFFRKNDAQQPHFAQLGKQFGGKTSGFVPLHDVGADLALGKFADGFA